MRMNVMFFIPLILIVFLLGVYLFPIQTMPFDKLYVTVGENPRQSLPAFRLNCPPKSLEVNGETWKYIVVGKGEQNILFLHGLAGSYDIWWQQIEALQDRYRVVSVTYPPKDSLEGLGRGILAILENEHIPKVNVIGSSLGGYLAQYLVAMHPERVEKAILGNTFPPNDLIAQQRKAIRILLPYLPAWIIMRICRKNITEVLYPASGNSELLRAFLLEQTYGEMSKAQIVARSRCVIDPFKPPDLLVLDLPILIVEADNDPLLDKTLRELLKATYPSTAVQTLHNTGHFPYLSAPEVYLSVIEQFLRDRGHD